MGQPKGSPMEMTRNGGGDTDRQGRDVVCSWMSTCQDSEICQREGAQGLKGREIDQRCSCKIARLWREEAGFDEDDVADV